MPFNVGILAGIGERYREDQEKTYKHNENLLKAAADTWQHIASMPNISPEGQQHAITQWLKASTADPKAKIPKDISDLSVLQQGLAPAPGREFTKTEPQQAAQVSPLQQPTSFDIPTPYGPQDKVGMFRSQGEMDQEKLNMLRKTKGIEAEFRPDRLQAVGPEQGLYDVAQNKWIREPQRIPKPDQSLTEWEVRRAAAEGQAWAIKALADKAQEKPETEESVDKQALAAYLKTHPGKNANDFIKERANYAIPATIRIENAANQAAGGGANTPGDSNSNLTDGLLRATANLQPAKKLQVSNAVNTLIKANKLDAAKATIRQAALDSEQDPQLKREATGRRISIQTLGEISKLLTSVPQGFLGGTVEDTVRRLGKTTDKRYVELGNRLEVLLQAYRKSITGAQFGQQESAEYEKIFPSYKNDPSVNQALIQSLTDQFKLQDSVYWDYKLGPGWSDAAMAAPINTPAPNPPEATGKIRVRNKATGKTGTLSPQFFDPNKYEKLQ